VRLSFDWLLDYVDVSDLSPQEVADKLTMGAFEVEEVRRVGPDIVGPVKVGEIVEINPHPNASKIRLTRVKIDAAAEPLEIVCGADNIIVGQRVPVALPGARVINRHDGSPLEIKPTKIRGVTSCGMLCSPPELGITGGESEGILILYGAPELGLDVIKLLRLYPDDILHVEPRSNRGDALSVKGMAREVAALCQRPMRQPAWRLPEVDSTSEEIEIKIENPQDCPFFSLRVLQGIRVGPSPLRITRRLEAVGVRPVNNVVDVTNYVLHELGQPLHAYDMARLLTRQMDVRRGRPGELLTTIDGRERMLTEEILTIAEGLRPLGVAGVMGGKESEISEETTFVALEAAAFHPARVRRSSRLLGLSSESSLRFERGVDPAGVRQASDRAAAMILESCGGYLGRLSHGGSDEVKPVVVSLRLRQLKRLAGIELSAREVTDLLAPLEFQAKTVSPSELSVFVPSFRQGDVSREIDLLEEVCRLYGYERIAPSMPASTVAPDPPDDSQSVVRTALAACGLNEAYISSLVGGDLATAAAPSHKGRSTTVRVLNPLSEDHQALRESLLPGLLKAVSYNQDRGRKDVWLFEIGRVYRRVGDGSHKETGVEEELFASAVVCGARALSRWQGDSAQAAPEEGSNFYVAKGMIENLAGRLGLPAGTLRFRPLDAEQPWLHPGRCCAIEHVWGDRRVTLGQLGDIHPAQADKLGLRGPISLFELSIDSLRAWRRQPAFAEVPATPPVVRDLTADLAPQIEHQAVRDCIVSAAGDNLRALELVSVFQLPGGTRSLSFRLTFQHPAATLTAEEVEQRMSSIRDRLKNQLGATFRA